MDVTKTPFYSVGVSALLSKNSINESAYRETNKKCSDTPTPPTNNWVAVSALCVLTIWGEHQICIGGPIQPSPDTHSFDPKAPGSMTGEILLSAVA